MNKIISTFINYAPVVSSMALIFKRIKYISSSRDIWVIILISFTIEFLYNKRYINFKITNQRIFYCALFLFSSLFLVYMPFERHTNFFYLFTIYRVPLMVLSFCGFLGFNQMHKNIFYLNSFIATCLISIFYLVVMKIGFFEFIESDNKLIFTECRIEYLNNHMKYDLYLNLGVISAWYILSNGYKQLSKLKISFYLVSIVIFMYFLQISEGRSGFLYSLITILFIIAYELLKRKKYALTTILICILSIFSAFQISNHSRISYQSMEQEPRLMLWGLSISLIKENLPFGLGASTAQEEFTSYRIKNQPPEYVHFWNEYDIVDSHNQYLKTTLEFGFLGLSLLLFLYIFPVVSCPVENRLLSFFLFMTMAFQSIFDDFITNQFYDIFFICSSMAYGGSIGSTFPKSS